VSISSVTSTTDKLQSSPVATQQLLLQAIYTLEIRNEQKRTETSKKHNQKLRQNCYPSAQEVGTEGRRRSGSGRRGVHSIDALSSCLLKSCCASCCCCSSCCHCSSHLCAVFCRRCWLSLFFVCVCVILCVLLSV
jgi:hypothetical protein